MWPSYLLLAYEGILPCAGKFDTLVKKDTNQISIYLLVAYAANWSSKEFLLQTGLYSKVWQKAHDEGSNNQLPILNAP